MGKQFARRESRVHGRQQLSAEAWEFFICAVLCTATHLYAAMPTWTRLWCKSGRNSSKAIRTNWLVIAIFLSFGSAVFGQRIDSFEGGGPRWILAESDCSAQLTEHEISVIAPHGGRTSELLELACSNGTNAVLAYPIEPAIALNEFEPRTWVRCASGGIQFGVRVVFPLDIHPITGGRLTAILWGEIYSTPGTWQALHVRQIERLLNEEIISLRQIHGQKLQLDGAYIDSVVLNAYTGSGRYRMQIDDLNLQGLIPLTATGASLPVDWRQRWRWRHELPSREQQFWAQSNRTPVWLAHSGEALPWVRSIGFNGVMLNQVPTEGQLSELRQSELNALCPPPSYAIDFDPLDARVIKGWLVGVAMDAGQAEYARDQAILASQLGDALSRPLVGESLEQHWRFGRIADELFVPQLARSSPGSWQFKQQWLAEKLSVLRPRSQGWVSISADVGPIITSQFNAAESALFGRPSQLSYLTDMQLEQGLVEIPNAASSQQFVADPLGYRHQAVAAVVAGARSLLLRTSHPLEDGSFADHAQIAAVRWTNHDLMTWGPWVAHGQMMARPYLSRQDYEGAVWSVSNSRLVIVCANSDITQYCVPNTFDRPLEIDLPRQNSLQQVVRITDGRAEVMPVESTRQAVKWAVEQPQPVEAFVVTSNPVVLSYLRKQLELTAPSSAVDRLDVVRFNLEKATELIDARFAQGPNEQVNLEAARPYLAQLATAQRYLDQASDAIRRRDVDRAARLAMQASDQIQAVFVQSYLVATENLSSPQASPFVLTPATLRMHWQLADACSRATWQDVAIPAGSFENLQEMLDSGWTQQRRLQEKVEMRVELVPSATNRLAVSTLAGHNTSASGLRLAAYQKPSEREEVESLEGGYEGASLRVRSAAVNVPAGYLVRVAATARLVRSTDRPDAGVLLYDNQAGPSLGQLIQGDSGTEQSVEMYRFMRDDGEFRILAECRGECDVVLEGVRISVIRPAQRNPNFETTPTSILPNSK